MPRRPLKTFIPTAQELLSLDLPTLGGILLSHLKSYEGERTVWQQSGLNQGYFLAFMEARGVGLGPMPKEPEYGADQPKVTPSGVLHTLCTFSTALRARVTFSRMSRAEAVQINGLGFWLCRSM